jgi:hypothetical protein
MNNRMNDKTNDRMIKCTIVKKEEIFDNSVFRIHTDNGIIFDAPSIFFDNIKNTFNIDIICNASNGVIDASSSANDTVFNGHVLSINDDKICISFGGLIMNIPKSMIQSEHIHVWNEISVYFFN